MSQHKSKSSSKKKSPPKRKKVRFKHRTKSKGKTKSFQTQQTSQSISFISRKYYKKKKASSYFSTSSYSEYDSKDEAKEKKKKEKKRKGKKGKKHKRTFSFKRAKKTKMIKKEDRSLSTWSKMEIAEWLKCNWNIDQSSKNNPKLLKYINKIKRDKKFDGKNISKLNNHCLKILAQRHLGLKKGDTDYKTFKKLIHSLQSKYSQPRSQTFTQTTFRSYKYKSIKLRINGEKQEKQKKQKKRSKTKTWRSRKRKTSKRNVINSLNVKLDFSTTSPAISADGGVTADELLTLISGGHMHCDEIDSDYEIDYDSDDNYIYNYNYKHCIIESPKDDDIDIDVEYDFASLYLSTTNSNVSVQSNSSVTEGHNNNNNNKTMVIPSIFALSADKENNKNMDICLSPIISPRIKCNNPNTPRGAITNIRCYSITDEDTDDDDQEKYKHNTNIKNMINDINSDINSPYSHIENIQTSKISLFVS